jgi:hypothetical protein
VNPINIARPSNQKVLNEADATHPDFKLASVRENLILNPFLSSGLIIVVFGKILLFPQKILIYLDV